MAVGTSPHPRGSRKSATTKPAAEKSAAGSPAATSTSAAVTNALKGDSTTAAGPTPSAAPAPSTKGRSQASNPTRSSTRAAAATTLMDPQRRRALIAESAYFRAERRGFAPGHEAEDWLAAEVEVDTALTVGVSSTPS